MLKRMAVLMTVVMLIGAVFGVQAQDKFSVGDSVEGTITDSEAAVTYTLSVNEGEIVVVEMRRAEDSDLYGTAMKITDPAGNEIYNNTSEVTEDVSIAGFRASERGNYTIEATRGEFSSSTGDFILRAIAVEELSSGTTEGNVTKDTYNHYYALPAGQQVSVSYDHRGGNYYLDFDVWLVTDDQGALRIATGGAIEDITTTFSFTTDSDYLTLVSFGASTIDFQYEDVDSDYAVTVS